MASANTMNGLWSACKTAGQRQLQLSNTIPSGWTIRRTTTKVSTRSSLRSISTSQILRPARMQTPLSTLKPSSSRRPFSATSTVAHGHWSPPKPGEEVYVTFIDKQGEEIKLAVNVGDDLLSIAQEHDIEMEGACEGSCSCSTCHVIVEDEAMYDKLEEADDDENDMLDIAFGLTETSRLGCQIKMTKELDGLVVRLPQKTRNMQLSDFQ